MGSAGKIPIWLDCDTGHDDAYAILLSAYHPHSRLLGVSSVHGNAPLEHTTNNCLAVLESLGLSSVDVVKGAAGPLQRPPSFATDFHGENGLAGVTLLRDPHTSPSPMSIDDVPAILLAQPAGTVQLVATGPLTNVALMLQKAPQLADHLAGLSIMGGAIGGGFTDAPLGTVEGQGERFGNWSPWAEFNIYADPEAAQVVLGDKTMASKTTLIPLDLTHQVRGTKEVQDLMFGEAKWESRGGTGPKSLPVLRDLFREILVFFSASYEEHFAIEDGPPLHDPLAVWAAIRPSKFTEENPKERWNVDVVVRPGRYHVNNDPQNHVGQTVLNGLNESGVRVPRGLDIHEFWKDIDDALTVATQAGGHFRDPTTT